MDLCLPYYQRHNCTYLPTATTLKEQQPLYHTTRQLYLLAYRNHLTITSTCLPYYQRHNFTHLPTATTLQQHTPVYHTTRDTTVSICLQQPPYNNIHLSAILPETQIYLPAYRNHITITSTCLPYYQGYDCTYPSILTCLQKPPYNNIHLSPILPETQLY